MASRRWHSQGSVAKTSDSLRHKTVPAMRFLSPTIKALLLAAKHRDAPLRACGPRYWTGFATIVHFRFAGCTWLHVVAQGSFSERDCSDDNTLMTRALRSFSKMLAGPTIVITKGKFLRKSGVFLLKTPRSIAFAAILSRWREPLTIMQIEN